MTSMRAFPSGSLGFSRQIACALQQGGWNGQPGGRCAGLGASPVSMIRCRVFSRSGSGNGLAESSAIVYGLWAMGYGLWAMGAVDARTPMRLATFHDLPQTHHRNLRTATRVLICVIAARLTGYGQ